MEAEGAYPRARRHRLVPFLSGAALAIIIDTGVEMYRALPSSAKASSNGSIVAEPAAKRPGVVPRDPPEEGRSLFDERVQEPRSTPQARKIATPMPSVKDVDAALIRALSRRGLAVEDLEHLDGVKGAAARLKAAQSGNDGRDVEAALSATLSAIQNAELSHAFLDRKLERIRVQLAQAEPAIGKERSQALQGRYLDAKQELARLPAAELGAYAVKLAKLLTDIREARGG